MGERVKTYQDCMEVREDFSAYLDGEMAGEEREGLEVHLAGCAECLRELDTLKRVDVAYRGLPAVNAPAGFEAGVREVVRAGRMPQEVARRPVPRWMGPLVAMATAAAVLIVSVIVLEVRQRNPQLQMADAPSPESADASAFFNTAPASSAPQEVSAPDQGSAGGGAAWDEFTRAAETAPEPLHKETKAEGAWESFTRGNTVGADTASPAGREDGNQALTDGLAGIDAEMRARADVIGEPSVAEEDAPVAEKIDADGAGERDAVTQVPAAPEVFGTVGEVVSRRVLRSFEVRADGTWVESGYADQPTTELKRGTDALNQVMRRHPAEAWEKMLDRTALQIFQLDGTWYALEGKPVEE